MRVCLVGLRLDPRSSEAALWSDPLDALTCDIRDDVVVGVVVQHDEPGALGDCRDEKVGKACRPMMFYLRELRDDILGSHEVSFGHRHSGKRRRALRAYLEKVAFAARA